MALLDDIRSKYNWAKDKTDLEIVDTFSQSSGRPHTLVAIDLGVELPNDPGFKTSFKNSMYGLAQGVGQLGGDFVPGVENNNALELYGRGGTQRNPVDIMDGEGGALSNLAGNLRERPLNTVGQIAGQALGLVAPGGLAKGGMAAYRGLRGLDALSKVGRGVQAAGETALYGVPSYGNMRDQQELQGDNSTEDKLKALASAAAIGGVERFAGLEGLLAGRTGAADTLGKTILRQGLGEAGEEIIQTPIEKFGGNQEVFNYDTLDQAAAGGLAGFIGGGMAGPLAFQMNRKAPSTQEPYNLLDSSQPIEDTAFDINSAVVPASGLEPVDIINSNTGVSRNAVDRKGYEKALQVELDAPSEERAIDPTTQTEVILTKGQALARQAGAPIEDIIGTKTDAPVWNYIDPDTQTLLPEPKDVVGAGKKKIEAYTLVADARTKGVIDQSQFENFTNQIAQTSKIGKVLPRITKQLGELNGNVQMRQDEVQLQGQTEGQGTELQESAAVQEKGVDLAQIASQLAPQQLKIFNALVEATQNNETDSIISGDGKLQYQAIAERAGLKSRGAAQAAINQTVAKISKLANIDVKQYLADRTNQVRTIEPSAESRIGLNPSMQASVVEGSDVFGGEDAGPTMGIIKSVGATDTDQSSVVSNNTRAQDEIQAQGTDILSEAGALDRGTVVMPEGDVTPSDNVVADAQREREALKGYLISHPEARNALNDWDNETIQLSDFDESDMISYLSDYIETVTADGFDELNAQQQTRVIEDLQVPIAQTIKQRLFNETKKPKGRVVKNTRERAANDDAGAVRSMAAPTTIEGNDRQDSGNTELGGDGAQAEAQLRVSQYAGAGTVNINGRRWIRRPATPEQLAVIQPVLDKIALDWGKQVDEISSVQVIADTAFPADAGVEMQPDGTYTLFVHPNVLEGNNSDGEAQDPSNDIERLITHEVAHIVDRIYRKFSGADFFDGVVNELNSLYTKEDIVAELFAYPFSFRANKGFDFRAEVFAELMSAYKHPILKNILKRAPKSYQFAEILDEHIRQNQTRTNREDVSQERTETARATNAPSRPAPTSTKQEVSGVSGYAQVRKPPQLRIPVRPEVSDAWKKLGMAMRELNPKLLTSTQLVEQYAGKIPALKTYIKAQNEMGAMASQLREASSKLLEVWGTYAFKNKAQNAVLMSVMHDATQAGIHPDAEFKSEPNAHLTDKDRAKYQELASRYAGLPEPAKKLYQQAKGLLASNWKLRQEIYNEVVTSAYEPRIAEAIKAGDEKTSLRLQRSRDADIAEHGKQIKSLKGPYFPLLRFGDYIVVAESSDLVDLRKEMETANPTEYKELAKKAAELEKSSSHYVVEAYESRLDMEKRKEVLTEKGFNTYERKAEAYTQETRPITAAALERINESLSTGFDKQTASKLKDLVTEMYVAALPEHHALQRQIKRKGVEGADANMMRAFAETIERDSFYLSRMKYAKDLTKGLMDIRSETRRMGIEEQNVYNNVVDRATADYQYEHTPILSALARMSSIFHLGVSPAFLLTNMTQPWFISVPQLAGAHGVTKTFAAMRSGWVDASKIIKQGKGGTLFNLADVDLTSITNPNERRLLERLRDVNKLDSTQLLDMGALSNGMKPVEMKAWKVFNWATHHIELVNRISTALATYRLERARNPNASQESLIEKAINMVDLTQLDYSNENAAYFMKPGVGLGKLNKIVFQFRKYQQGMIYLLARDAKLAWRGDKEALKSLGYLMGTQLLFAGTTGLPITAPLLFLAYGLAGDDDDEKGDLETQIRNYAADILGPDAARVFWKGLPTALGVDLSSNIGMGNLFKPLPMMSARDVTDANTGEDAIKEMLFNAAGAPVGMISNMADGLLAFEDGDYRRGITRMTPRFAASVFKAGDLADSGVMTRSGSQVMTADQFDGWDIALKAAGFNPISLTEHYAAQTSKEDTSRAIQERRNNLLQQYAVAKLNRDDLTSIREDIRAFNVDHPKVKLDQSALIRAVENRKKSSGEVDEAGVRFRKNETNLTGIDRFAY